MRLVRRGKPTGTAFIVAGIVIFLSGIMFYMVTYYQVKASLIPIDSLLTAQNLILLNSGVGAVLGAYGAYADWKINTGRIKIRHGKI